MRLDQKYTTIEKIVIKLASPGTFIVILFITITMSIGIFISDNLSLWNFEPSSKGWENIWMLFKAPISVFLGGTTIYGILLAVRRTIILEEQIKLTLKQYETSSHENRNKNYSRNMEEFIKTLEDYRDNFVLTRLTFSQIFRSGFTKDFFRDLFIKWFGTSEEYNYKIKDEIKNNLDAIYKIIDEHLDAWIESDHNKAKNVELIRVLNKIGLNPFTHNTKLEHISHIIGIYNFCERILRFSSDRIDPYSKKIDSKFKRLKNQIGDSNPTLVEPSRPDEDTISAT